jgi:hypothetical protein
MRRGEGRRTKEETMSSTVERLAPLAGVGFGVLALAGDLTVDAFPDTATPVTSLTSYYAAHHTQVHRGGELMALSTVFLVFFGAALWARARRGASPVIAAGLLVGSALLAATDLRDAGAFSVVGEIGGLSTTDPAALQAWHLAGTSGPFASGLVVLLLAVGLAGVVQRALPRWVGWSALVLAVLQVTPLAFLASMLFLLWSVVVGIALTFARTDDCSPSTSTATVCAGT